MYNIVRHLVEGREGIETFNLSKTEHLNAYANQIRTSSFSVCCVCVCVCVCCSHSFGFGFGYFCSRSLSRLAFGSCSCSCSCSCSSAAWYSFFSVFVFASRSVSFACVFNTIYFSVASFVHFKLQLSSVFFVFVVFLFCVFVYTAEFLPIISPLRECTKRPSNSMVEFCLMLPVGVRRGSFSSLYKKK